MKTQRRLISAVLLVSLLLSLFDGSLTSAAAAQAATTVTTDRELAYEPLTQTASIAYEQHEAGYEVSLDRSADNVAMNITAVPGDGSSRAVEKAQLYIRTGVTLKPNTAYRVSFSLWAKRAQPEYAVCFDGGSVESAYGSLEGRSIEADGRDQVQYQVTPESEHGELILRLLLGKTGAEGNTLRFSNLAVEEVSQNEVGSNVVLADNLNYNAPGFIRVWTNTDRAATVTCDEKSATLTVTKGPIVGAEVWKIKLLAATGFKPTAGKTYHFTADVVSTAAQGYELCYNEGDTEKGFGAEYSQWLTGKSQKLDHMIRISKDKKDPGELIIQFSLGKLKTGDKVTISNISITEASASYRSVLSDSFSFTGQNTTVALNDPGISAVGLVSTSENVNWSGTATVSEVGDFRGGVTVLDGCATMGVNGGKNVWDAKLNVDTHVRLEAGTTYRVSFDALAYRPYSNYEVVYGTAMDEWNNNNTYGTVRGLTLGTTWETVEYLITPERAGGLLFTLQVGAAGGRYNAVSVRNVNVEAVREGRPGAENLATVTYLPVGMTCEDKSINGNASTASYANGVFTMDVTSVSVGEDEDYVGWKSKLCIKTDVTPESGKKYEVSFDIKGAKGLSDWEAHYGKGGDNDDYGVMYKDQTPAIPTGNPITVTKPITGAGSGKLWIILQLGQEVNTYWISNVKVEVDTENPPDNPDPAPEEDWTEYGTLSFKASNTSPNVSSSGKDGDAITLDVTAVDSGDPATWKSKLYIKTGKTLEDGKKYDVSFDIKGQNAQSTWGVDFGKGADNTDCGNIADGTAQAIPIGDPVTVTKTINGKDGELWLILRLGQSVNKYWVTNVKVEEKEETPGNEIFEPSNTPGNMSTASIDGNKIKMEVTEVDEGNRGTWRSKLYIKTGRTLASGKLYAVSFDIKASASPEQWEINYGKGADNQDYGVVFESQLPPVPTSETLTVTQIIPGDGAELWIIPCLGYNANTTYWISNIKVEEITISSAEGDGAVAARSIDNGRIKYDVTAAGNGPWSAQLIIPTGIKPGSDDYEIRFNIEGKDNVDTPQWNAVCGIDSNVDSEQKSYGAKYNLESLNIKGSSQLISIDSNGRDDASRDGELFIRIQVGTGTNCYWIQNIRVTATNAATEGTALPLVVPAASSSSYGLSKEDSSDRINVGKRNSAGEKAISLMTLSGSGSSLQAGKATYYSRLVTGSMNVPGGKTTSRMDNSAGSFDVREAEGCSGSITGDGTSYVTMTCTGGPAPDNSTWQRGLLINDLCDLRVGHSYRVSFDIEASEPTSYDVCYNKDTHFEGGEKIFGAQYSLTASSKREPVTETITPEANGRLLLRLDLGRAKEGATVTVRNIKVQEIQYTTVSTEAINGFVSVWEEHDPGYTAALDRQSDKAVYTVRAGSGERQGYFAKLFIHTGVTYDPDKPYRVKFDIKAENAQKDFCVISKGVSDDEDIRGTWSLSIGAGETKTITTRAIPAGMGEGELILQIELGKLDATENTFTVSNVRVEEVDFSYEYETELTCRGNTASLRIKDTPPAAMLEPWKVKMFVDTGVYADEDETYRVTFDLWVMRDMDFEVNYNRYDTESGYGSLAGLHAAANKETTVEHFFTASKEGVLKLQVMLGKTEAPNVASVRNLRIERVTYFNSSKSALPVEPVYQTPSAVSYWAHEDYTATFTGSDKAVTANIKSAPSNGAEAWKIKLFLDTGMVLQAGKYYKVTTNVKAKAAQDYEICYNNGGIEMGYDSLGGLRLAAGETQTVERIISVPAGKADVNNLTLQFNLGKTTAANTITVSGVKVEEAALSYTDMMSKNFAYTAGGTVKLWTNSDYTAKLEGAGGKATLHITDVPSTGAEVWKVKLLVNTGAVLSAGKTYLVHADLLASKAQNYEVCFNNEETEKGFDALYNQSIKAGSLTAVEKKISVPDSMTDAGELILQFSVGGAAANDITISNVSVKELNFGAGSGNPVTDTVINLYNAPQTAAGTLDVTRGKLTYKMTKISSAAKDNAITIAGADLRAGDLYTVAFTARADKNLTGTFALNQANGKTTVISDQFKLTPKETNYSFTTKARLSEGGIYDLLWQFGSAENQRAGGADVEISNITVYSPPEKLTITKGKQNVTVNGKLVTPDTYNINGSNYIKLRDLALLLNDTDAQFVVRYNAKTKLISLTTGKPYTPVGGELTAGVDRSASCVRSAANITVNGKKVNLKAYNIGKNNFFRLRDLNELLGFQVEYVTANNAAAITSPLTPEAQEKGHAYDLFFLPEIDGESQPYVGDTMPFYDNGVYYTYYLKDGGDSYNHSVYVTTTTDFVKYKEYDNPVLSASRADVQDNWIGTGSVVKAEDTYYFFYTGFNASGSQEYHEKIMVAKGSSPTSFEKVGGWEIVPPAELGQKNDFRDPQAYYDPASKTISLTITTNQDGKARIVKYTLGKDLQSVKYDGIIFTDPTGEFWNLECSDTFKMGNKWYLTYSGQDDTLWYAMADSQFGPYSNATRLEGKLFYAAKHVEDGENTYMVGWARRGNSASSTQEVGGWAGNLAVQKLYQKEDGSLVLVPVDSIAASFDTQKALGASEAALTAGSNYSYKAAFTSYESFMLKGEFTYSGTGSFGLAFDFNGNEEQYKLISLNPATNKLSLSFNEGTTPITETKAVLSPNQTHSFTYIQDGSVGIFYLDNQAALLVRLYGVTDKPIYLFTENNSVTFTSLRQYT